MERDRTQRRVLCAALRAEDGSVLVGIRHYSADMVEQIQGLGEGGLKFKGLHDTNQGFVDTRGVYMDRFEAYQVALAAGQLWDHDESWGEELYSESLY